MSKPSKNNAPMKSEMNDKGKSVFARLQNAANKAFKPSGSQSYTIYNAVAAVHVEQSRITNCLGRFGDDQQHAAPSKRELHGVHDESEIDIPSSLDVQETPISIQPDNKQSIALCNDDTGIGRSSSAMERDLSKASEADQGQAAIFLLNGTPIVRTSLPKNLDRIEKTPQLVFCLTLLTKDTMSSPSGSESATLPPTHNEDELAWIKAIEQEPVKQHHMHWLATRLVEEFIKDNLKGSIFITEIIYLSSVLDREHFRRLLCCVIAEFEMMRLLDTDLLQGLVQLVQCAQPGYLIEDDLVKLLNILRMRLQDTHQQSTGHLYHLTLAVSRVLDIMVKHEVKGVNRIEKHKPLLDILTELKDNSDPYLKFQAGYAYQALQYIPDDESPLEAFMRFAGGLTMGVLGVASVFKLDPANLFTGLENLMQAAGQANEVVRAAIEGAQAFRAGGESSVNSLVKGFGEGKKKAWYIALQGARVFIRENRLDEFKRVVFEAPCHHERDFQWGICQLLGEVALDPMWEITTRQQAVTLLTELYTKDPEWSRDTNVKTWILTIIRMVSDDMDHITKGTSTFLQQYINKTGVTDEFATPYLFRSRLPLPTDSPLLARVQEIPYVEYELHQLKTQRMKEYDQVVYVPPLAKANLQANDKDASPLMEKIKEFLDSDRQVFLVLGDSGAGKSTFNKHLEHELWKEYKQDDPIPLFINLPAINEPWQDMIDKQLRIHRFSEPMIKELKEHHQMILICDGYDETQLKVNLHTTNMLNRQRQANTKMIISCRSTYLGQDYRNQFQPQGKDRYNTTTAKLYTEAVIVPFSNNQIENYVDQFVRDPEVHKLIGDKPIWSTEDYMDKLKSIPNLMELVKNPFLLTLSLRALPGVVKDAVDLAKIKVTRLTLYDSFIDQWLEINKLRLETIKHSVEEEKALQELLEEGFAPVAIDFLKDLAAAIFKEQDGNPVVQYTSRSDKGTWKFNFFGSQSDIKLLRECSPLSRAGVEHRFMHRSLLEYFYSRRVYETDEHKGALPEVSLDLANHPLGQRNLVKEPSIIQFLVEHVQSDPGFQQRLHQIIELSKTDVKASQAAANAISILVRAGVTFNGADLKGIRIPNADLSGGQFDSAQLEGADLRGTNLCNIWMRQADLSNAQMASVQFGEWPYLQEDSNVQCCVYSPDGKNCAVGLGNGIISVYDTTTWAKVYTLSGHTDYITSVVYSPSGQQIASGSKDSTVRLWDAHTGAPGPILSGHTAEITSVVYSPSGQQIASGSKDSTVRLWDTQSGAPGPILSGHTDWITSLVYSPSSQQIASGSYDEMVRLWDAQSGAPGPILSGHTDWIMSVTYSPNGQHIASGSRDSTVRLWNVQSGAPGPILGGHTDYVTSVMYSPSGQQIASGSNDKTVRLWDTQSGAPGPILSGHTDYITSVMYSPSGQQIASGSEDKTVRLWDTQTGAPGPILSGHTSWLTSVVYSPSGQQIASGSWDKTVRLWDAQSGAPGAILSGHADYVTSVAYSPNGQHIVSGGRDSTRLWDAQSGAPGPILSHHASWVMSVAYSPNGQQIASGSDDNTVRLWDAQSGAPGPILSGHTNWITSVVYSPSGQQIASGSWDSTVRLWDAQSGAPGPILSGHTGYITSVVYSPDGQQIASGSNDKTVQLWDVQSGAPGPILSGHADYVTSVAYSPSGQHIASGSRDSTVRLWDVRSGAPGPVLSGHTDYVTSVMYSPSGQQIASGSDDKMVRLWDAQSGAPGPILSGHTNWITSVVYSPSGQQIASGSYDNTVRLWDAGSGQCLAVVEGFHGTIYSIAWYTVNNGLYFATGCGDKSVRVWQVVEKGDRCLVHLHWSSFHGQLVVSDTIIQDVQGLSNINMQLLNQRGAKVFCEQVLLAPATLQDRES